MSDAIKTHFDMLSIRSILVMPNQCRICGRKVSKHSRNNYSQTIHLALKLETACPADVSGLTQAIVCR